VGVATVGLPERQLRRVLGAAAACNEIDLRQDGIVPLLDALADVVTCDVLFWNAFRTTPFCEIGLVPGKGTDPPRAPLEGWLEHLSEHPVMSGRHGPVVAVSDVVPPREFERTWMYQNAFRPAGVRHEIGLELSHPANAMSVVVLSRTGGRDFDERDHLALQLLRPHADAALRRLLRPAPRLTPRQVDVVRLVRDGLTDAQIARRMDVTESTVGKHLEHVYARTGARNRAHAVLLCEDLLALGADRGTRPVAGGE
jgi:DNA-binding CsgD family transcriptional regulator